MTPWGLFSSVKINYLVQTQMPSKRTRAGSWHKGHCTRVSVSVKEASQMHDHAPREGSTTRQIAFPISTPWNLETIISLKFVNKRRFVDRTLTIFTPFIYLFVCVFVRLEWPHTARGLERWCRKSIDRQNVVTRQSNNPLKKKKKIGCYPRANTLGCWHKVVETDYWDPSSIL